MNVPIAPGTGEPGTLQALFPLGAPLAGSNNLPYQVAADGERFLVRVWTARTPRLVFVLQWNGR